MCIAKDYSEQLLSIYNNINLEVRRLCAVVNTADLYDMDMLHIIEKGGFNACEGYKLAKMVHENRVSRRQAKNELEPLKRLKNNFIDKNMELLNKTHQEVIRRDIILTDLTERKVYNNRVIGKSIQEIKTPVVVANKHMSPVVKPPQIKSVSLSNKTRHKNSNEEIQVISKIDDILYLVRRKDNRVEVMRKTLILGLEDLELQVAK